MTPVLSVISIVILSISIVSKIIISVIDAIPFLARSGLYY